MSVKRKFMVTVDLVAGEVTIKELSPQKRDVGGRFLDTGKGRGKVVQCKFFSHCPMATKA